ncbi:MAG: ParB/RepB/Spo0J family partition protein [Bacteroidales bacterium]|nr:ParB/RepB/Spo0J family partition protein [Bacteroidales bacterium]MCF8344385.1 ParB/RepB/Spo0J family partition protein [Bacteroidales bacterium]MCF8350397.1 ParB/RepB/Spo0J family partition protein [Bacteroidales bacterium]MCF8375292.1 ParB/RepB/Spo0J family partition protein [Bacteroidales bacterium]MCF8400148.1 ParB/RepB/Spo0J family partition protein [Bacteroidales bacterium]
MTNKKKALGKGLAAILSSPETDITSKDISGNYVVGAIADIEIGKIEANPFQPRDQFDEESLRELANSIEEQGIIQPLTVRKLGYDHYQLISGERRLKASKIAGMEQVPCYIRVANDEQMLEMALVENIHRENLNAIEIAISYQRLVEECQLTHEKLSERIGKNRSTITNYLRLLKLPPAIQLALKEEQITMGHARAVINLDDEDAQSKIIDRIIKEDLSVRQIEKLVKDHAEKGKKEKPSSTHKPLPENFQKAREELSKKLDSEIDLKRNTKGSGRIVIPFKSDEDFRRILDLLGGENN